MDMIPVLKLELSEEDRRKLTKLSRSKSIPSRDSFRARIILCRADGFSKLETAKKLGTSEQTVQKWTSRYKSNGISGLSDAKGRGRKQSIAPELRERILTEATQPPKGTTRHSTRTMARLVGVSQSTVHRTWRDNDIKPHLVRTFKISRDPNFCAKFWDVIGLYLNPPENAIVFCCDEKTQCQALDRTHPGLPLGIGHIKTATHDYIRNGTTNLFAALNYATGEISHRRFQKHTHKEWLSFLKTIWKETPGEVSIHVIADNYATHKHPKVTAWLAKHTRIQVHYTPTSSSWLNLVERFFGEITRDCIRDGSFSSVAELIKANDAYISQRNKKPVPFVWHAKGEEILRKINTARRLLNMSELEIAPPTDHSMKTTD